MDKKLSDEQIDRIAKNLLENFSPSAEALDEIAAAPQLWRSVRNRIEAETARRESARFGWFRAPRLAFGAALAVLICGALALGFLSFADNSKSPAARATLPENPARQIAEAPENPPVMSPEVDSEKAENRKPPIPEKVSPKVSTNRAAPRAARFVAKTKTRENSTQLPRRSSDKETPAAAAVEETKTDFIALSYAANTESGQIVRVKVPSSMLVTLGVRTEVKDAAELVSAEVVIGDDGLARAIRFIR